MLKRHVEFIEKEPFFPSHTSRVPFIPRAAFGLGLCDEMNILSEPELDRLTEDLGVIADSHAVEPSDWDHGLIGL